MVQALSAELIASLSAVTSHTEQLDCLKRIKNGIIGYDQRKELAVKNGLIQPIVDLLSDVGHDLSNGHGTSAATVQHFTATPVQLEAITILGIIAAGGSQFVPPLHAAGVDRKLTVCLSAASDDTTKIATLHALKNFAQSHAALCDLDDAESTPAHDIFSSQPGVFGRIFSETPTSASSVKQIQLACDVVTFAARSEHAKDLLVFAEAFDHLTVLFVTQSEATLREQVQKRPTQLASIVPALCTIIGGSTFRARRFVHSLPVRQMSLKTLKQCDQLRDGTAQRTSATLVPVLPATQTSPYKSFSFYNEAIPAWHEQSTNAADDDAYIGFGVILRLLLYARNSEGMVRLHLLHLLSLIDNAISEADNVTIRPLRIQKMRDRERHLAMLAVPLAVRLVQDSADTTNPNDSSRQIAQKAVKEQACSVLAMLVARSKELQCSATDAGAIKYVCPLLRKSFDNVVLSKPMWVPQTPASQTNLSATCKLGDKGLPAEVMHVMKCRLGALAALAALADKEDYHRKAIVESGVVSCVIASLKPYNTSQHKLNAGNNADVDGNVNAVILAACNAALALSRSVSLLRTSLIDAGIAKPILDLLHHPKIEIKIAATNVCTNLVLEFSPMREDLLAHGVVETLCEHAKNGVTSLRLSSLWALKHLVLTAPVELKISILRSLGPSWLVDAITGQYFDSSAQNGGVSVALNSANAAGEQVNILNDSSMEIDRSSFNETSETNEDDNEDGELLYDEASHTHYHSSSIRSTLRPSRIDSSGPRYLIDHNLSSEPTDPAVLAQQDDLAIQTQALDFIRNVLTGDQCAEMVEHVFTHIGQQRMLDLLTTKLSPISAWPHRHHLRPSTASKSSSSRPLYSPTELISAAVHVVVHIANGSVAQKAALIAHRSVLQALQPHFQHPNNRIRVMCVWCVNALTFLEDERDRNEARKRAHELRGLGLEGATRALISDPDLDVRERVKTAVRQMDAL